MTLNMMPLFLFIEGSESMSSGAIIAALYVFALAAFLGYQVISRVPPLLHTPLMSATNAISGISLVGSIVIAGGTGPHHSKVAMILGFIAVICSTTNVVGGFVITDRMLRMFKRKEKPAAAKADMAKIAGGDGHKK
jgi:H+-translocating NAD(P) transhydrogenase subunit alpha